MLKEYNKLQKNGNNNNMRRCPWYMVKQEKSKLQSSMYRMILFLLNQPQQIPP